MDSYIEFPFHSPYIQGFHAVKPLIDEYENMLIPYSGKSAPYRKVKMTPKQLRSRKKSKAAKRKRK
jgi:hypothetical protein